MTGKEFKRIRNIAGFTAKEFAEYINMSTSHVYSLEQYYDKHITPRREEEFKEFLGITIYNKSKRIYELEIQQQEIDKREREERQRRKEIAEQKYEEQQRLLRQQQLEEKKAIREAALEDQIKVMESRISAVETDNTDEPAATNHEQEAMPEGKSKEDDEVSIMGGSYRVEGTPDNIDDAFS